MAKVAPPGPTCGMRTKVTAIADKNIVEIKNKNNQKGRNDSVLAMADPALCGTVILELDSLKSPPAGLVGLSAAVAVLGMNR